ncbi:MAG: Beta-galactosidase C-terminal domain [Geminicoccaceae bacterium]
MLDEIGVETLRLREPLRLRRRGGLTFAFNSGAESIEAPAPKGANFLTGGAEIPARGVAVWKS